MELRGKKRKDIGEKCIFLKFLFFILASRSGLTAVDVYAVQ